MKTVVIMLCPKDHTNAYGHLSPYGEGRDDVSDGNVPLFSGGQRSGVDAD